MAKVCVELSDLVILSGVASFGFLVWDHAKNERKVMAEVKHFSNEFMQSLFTRHVHTNVVANKVESKAEKSNDSQKKTSAVVNSECHEQAVSQKSTN